MRRDHSSPAAAKREVAPTHSRGTLQVHAGALKEARIEGLYRCDKCNRKLRTAGTSLRVEATESGRRFSNRTLQLRRRAAALCPANPWRSGDGGERSGAIELIAR